MSIEMKDDNVMPDLVEELIPNLDRAEEHCGSMLISFIHYFLLVPTWLKKFEKYIFIYLQRI